MKNYFYHLFVKGNYYPNSLFNGDELACITNHPMAL